MEVMHEAIEAQTNGGLALLSALTTDKPLYYPTTLGALLPIQRYGRDLIEPDKVYFDLAETDDFQPLLIDSEQSLVTVGGKDIHLARIPERVALNCLLAQKGNGWFSSRDISLALLANGMDRARFTPACKALGRMFAQAAGVELFITASARRANNAQY